MANISGTQGKDTLSGGSGNDSIYGQSGDDRILTGDGDDYVEGGDGNDEVNGYPTSAGFSYWSATGRKTVKGGLGDDFIVGGADRDQLDGEDGDDTIYGQDGDDSISGGSGNDLLTGGVGNDTLIGGEGKDALDGDAGDDLLDGGNGDDELNSQSAGADTLKGGAGNDKLDADTGTGNKLLDGGAGNDTLYGGVGSDTLIGGEGKDALYGGAGDDTYHITNLRQFIDDSSGFDTAYVNVSFAKIPDSIENVIYADGVQRLPYWIDALLPNEASGLAFNSLLGAENNINYSFPAKIPSYASDGEISNGWAPFTEIQKSRAIDALNYISSIIDIKFYLSNNSSATNTIAFSTNTQKDSSGLANYPSSDYGGSDVWLDNSPGSPDNSELRDGTFGAYVLIHEIGHALGLEHPFPKAKDKAGGDAPSLSDVEDRTEWTVMSYTQSPTEYYLKFSPLDIAALHYLYGPSKTSRNGNDTYSISTIASNFIWDGLGTDTLSAADCLQGCTLYITPGYWGYVGSSKASTITSPGQVTVNFGTVIENLVGSAFSDRLFGNEISNSITGGNGDDSIDGGAGNDTLIGGSGNDTLIGGDGESDIAVFQGPFSRYSFLSLSGGATIKVTDTNATGDGIDTVSSVELFRFADGDRTRAQILSVNNTAPVSSNGSATTAEDTPRTGSLPSATDANGDTINYSKASNPANGSVIVASNGSYTYTPNANFNGTDSFTFTVSDGNGGSNTYTQTITVTSVNDAPVVANAVPDQGATAGTAFNYIVPANAFTDVDNASLTYSATLANGAALPSWLSFNPATRTFSGTPTSANLGSISIRVTASDGSLAANDTFDLLVEAARGLNLIGTAQAETLKGGSGNDVIDGGGGIDTVVYTRTAAGYSLDFGSGQVKIADKSGLDGTDTLISIERLQFADRTVTLDSRSHSGFGDIPATMYQFFILAFGAAPGVEYLQQCADAYRAGADVKRITNVFCSKSQFTDIYPTGLSNRELATKLVNNVVGASATPSAKDAAVNDITGALNNGLGVGDMIFTVFSNLAAKQGDATWGGTAQLFFNQIAVAKYYTEVLNQSTTDRATLASAISMVKADSDVSTEAAIVTLIGQGLLGG